MAVEEQTQKSRTIKGVRAGGLECSITGELAFLLLLHTLSDKLKILRIYNRKDMNYISSYVSDLQSSFGYFFPLSVHTSIHMQLFKKISLLCKTSYTFSMMPEITGKLKIRVQNVAYLL